MPYEDLLKMRHDRGKLINEMQSIEQTATAEKRTISADENARLEKLYADNLKLKADIEAMEASDAQRSKFDALYAEAEKEKRAASPVLTSTLVDPSQQKKPGAEYRGRFNKFLLGDINEKDQELRALMFAELRGMNMSDPTQGGYFVAPMEMQMELIKDVDALMKFRKYARVLPPLKKVVSLGYPQLTTKMSNSAFQWTSELSNALEDTSMRIGRRVFIPHVHSSFVKLSKDLLRNAMIDPDVLVRSELARVKNEGQEAAFVNGDGNQKPLGLFTQHADGITSARYIATHNSATDIETDNLLACKYALKEQYRNSPGIAWLFHTDAILKIMLKKDGNGQYIWRPGLVEGQPDRLLNYPVIESTSAPNVFTTGLPIGCLGDFKHYWIADVAADEFNVLDQLYAMTNEIGYLVRGWTEGAPVREEAFVISTLG